MEFTTFILDLKFVVFFQISSSCSLSSWSTKFWLIFVFSWFYKLWFSRLIWECSNFCWRSTVISSLTLARIWKKSKFQESFKIAWSHNLVLYLSSTKIENLTKSCSFIYLFNPYLSSEINWKITKIKMVNRSNTDQLWEHL